METFNYIGKDYYKKFFTTAEDTIINLISLCIMSERKV